VPKEKKVAKEKKYKRSCGGKGQKEDPELKGLLIRGENPSVKGLAGGHVYYAPSP